MRTNSYIPRKVVYKLKQQYGRPAGLYSYQDVVTDYDTGTTTKSYNIYEIRKVVILNNIIKRDFVYDLSYIAANKNFTYGGFFDTGERQVLIDSKDLNVTIQEKDHLLFDDERYEVKQMHDYGDAYLLIVKYIDADSPFETTMKTFKESWTAPILSTIANDELIRDLRNNIYNGGAFPSNILLWTCSGNNLTQALKCILHPDGIGTSLTNVGFPTTKYIERGDTGGLQSDGTDYLNTGYNIGTQTTYDNFLIALYGRDFDELGDMFGATTFRIRNGDFETEVTLDLGSLSSGCIIINSNASDSLKAYVNGTLVDSDVTTRSTALPSSDMYLFESNGGSNPGAFTLSTAMIGNGIADGKISTLNDAIVQFNTRLGR